MCAAFRSNLLQIVMKIRKTLCRLQALYQEKRKTCCVLRSKYLLTVLRCIPYKHHFSLFDKLLIKIEISVVTVYFLLFQVMSKCRLTMSVASFFILCSFYPNFCFDLAHSFSCFFLFASNFRLLDSTDLISRFCRRVLDRYISKNCSSNGIQTG